MKRQAINKKYHVTLTAEERYSCTIYSPRAKRLPGR